MPPSEDLEDRRLRKSAIEQHILAFERLGIRLQGASMQERMGSLNGYIFETLRALSPSFVRGVLIDGRAVMDLPSELQDLITVRQCIEQGPRIFRLAEEFGQALQRTRLDAPVGAIPRVEETVLIEFPDWAHGKFPNGDGTYALACYLRQEPTDLIDGAPGRLLRLQFPDYDASGNLLTSSTWVSINLAGDTECTLDERIDFAESRRLTTVRASREAIRLAVSSYIYVHSGTPDLRPHKARPLPTTRKEKKLRSFLRDSAKESLLDLTILGFDYKKPRTFSVDETLVEGHWRKQPHGPGRSQIRVIWIDEHTRRYERYGEGFVATGCPTDARTNSTRDLSKP